SPSLPLYVLLRPGGATTVVLHAFPTRRSSDLSARGEGRPHRSRLGPRRSRRADGGRSAGRGEAGPDRALARRAPAGRALRRRPRDRKSTRLNSSHEWISYAGFCLKKTNKHATL